jgi:hypothetical protein
MRLQHGEDDQMSSARTEGLTLRQAALIVGFTYLLSHVGYAEFSIYPKLVIAGNISQTVANISSHHGLFLAGYLLLSDQLYRRPRLRYGRRWAPVTKPSSTGRRPMRQAASFGRFDNVWYGRGVGLIGNVRPQRLANRY